MDAATITELAEEIYAAERRGTPIDPLSSRYPELTPRAAYAVQEGYARLRTQAGARLIGRKIGCTSEPIQQRFGIGTPDYGQLFDDMVIDDRGTIATDELIQPLVEPEIGFLLGAELRGPGVTAPDVLRAAVSVFPALEIIDSRIRDWRIAFVDTVADNGSSARCVFGRPTRLDGTCDVVGERVRLLRDGSEFDTGSGAAVLGDPAASVAWLANALGDFGQALRAGDYILSGSMTGAAPVRAGGTYRAVFDTLGSVSCRFEKSEIKG